jgi:hypothetical protein
MALIRSFRELNVYALAWLDHAHDCGYISAKQLGELDARWQSVGGMINKMIDRADAFCEPTKP